MTTLWLIREDTNLLYVRTTRDPRLWAITDVYTNLTPEELNDACSRGEAFLGAHDMHISQLWCGDHWTLDMNMRSLSRRIPLTNLAIVGVKSDILAKIKPWQAGLGDEGGPFNTPLETTRRKLTLALDPANGKVVASGNRHRGVDWDDFYMQGDGIREAIERLIEYGFRKPVLHAVISPSGHLATNFVVTETPVVVPRIDAASKEEVEAFWARVERIDPPAPEARLDRDSDIWELMEDAGWSDDQWLNALNGFLKEHGLLKAFDEYMRQQIEKGRRA